MSLGKILIVDDDRNLLEIIEMRLASSGYTVTTTLAEEEARKRAEEEAKEEARKQRALLEEIVANTEEAVEEAKEARRIEKERLEAESKGRAGIAIDPATGQGFPVYIPPRHSHKKKRSPYEFRLDKY